MIIGAARGGIQRTLTRRGGIQRTVALRGGGMQRTVARGGGIQRTRARRRRHIHLLYGGLVRVRSWG